MNGLIEDLFVWAFIGLIAVGVIAYLGWLARQFEKVTSKEKKLVTCDHCGRLYNTGVRHHCPEEVKQESDPDARPFNQHGLW